MVFMAIYGWNEGNFSKLTATFDGDGNACGVTAGVTDYKYAYFGVPHADYLNATICVKSCPTYDVGADRPTTLDAY